MRMLLLSGVYHCLLTNRHAFLTASGYSPLTLASDLAAASDPILLPQISRFVPT
jgi:hypothetical protein